MFSLNEPLTSFLHNPSPPLTMRYGTIYRSYRWPSPDAVELQGPSLEELEAQPGFSFAPSAAYLRSVMG